MRNRQFQDWSRDHEGGGRRSWRDRLGEEEGDEPNFRGRESYEPPYRAGQGGASDLGDRPRHARNQERGSREAEYGNRGDQWDQRYRMGEYERYGNESDYGRERDARGGYGPELERGAYYGYDRERSGRWSAQNRDFGYGNRFARDDDPGNYRGFGSGSYGSRASFGGGAYDGGYGGSRGPGHDRDYEGSSYGQNLGGGMSLDEGRFTTRGQYGGGQYGGQRRTGNAPKGYKRSDDRIREDVCDRLSERWDVDSQGIEVSVSNGEVTLSGLVPERGMKFRAESISDGVSGVSEVHNQLRIQQQGHGQQAQTRESGITPAEGFKNNAAQANRRS